MLAANVRDRFFGQPGGRAGTKRPVGMLSCTLRVNNVNNVLVTIRDKAETITSCH